MSIEVQDQQGDNPDQHSQQERSSTTSMNTRNSSLMRTALKRALKQLSIPVAVLAIAIIFYLVFCNQKTYCPPIESLVASHMPSGRYCFTLQNEGPNIIEYIDFNQGEAWIRLTYRNQSEVYPSNIEGTNLQWLVQDIGVSDNLTTMKVEYSWILRDAHFNCSKVLTDPSVYPPKFKNATQCDDFLNSFVKGRTPTNSSWNKSYDRGYLNIHGRLETYGNWTSMYEGCNYESVLKVGENASFRIGGSRFQTGEFIHSNCNAYNPRDHSITSLILWDDTIRVIWMKPKLNKVLVSTFIETVMRTILKIISATSLIFGIRVI